MEKYYEWMRLFHEKIVKNQAYLSELDTPIGDGDHGANMARGMGAVMEALDEKQPNDLKTFYQTVGMALITKVGGASGPLYGSAFIAMSQAADESLELQLQRAFEAIKKRGKSELGEKTILDLWGPALEDLQAGKLEASSLKTYAEKTQDLKATKGRASYLGDRSVGHIDPGAMSSAYLFEALLEAGLV